MGLSLWVIRIPACIVDPSPTFRSPSKSTGTFLLHVSGMSLWLEPSNRLVDSSTLCDLYSDVDARHVRLPRFFHRRCYRHRNHPHRWPRKHRCSHLRCDPWISTHGAKLSQLLRIPMFDGYQLPDHVRYLHGHRHQRGLQHRSILVRLEHVHWRSLHSVAIVKLASAVGCG